MKLSDVDGNEYTDVTSDVKRYYKGTNILRLGAEYRVTPQFSLRAGYSYESSPVKEEASSGREAVWTAEQFRATHLTRPPSTSLAVLDSAPEDSMPTLPTFTSVAKAPTTHSLRSSRTA